MADDVKTGIRVVVEGEQEFEKDVGKVANALEGAATSASNAETQINNASTATGNLATESGGSASTFISNMEDMSLAVIASIAGIVKVVSEVIEALDTLASQTAEYGEGVQKGAGKIDFSTDAYQEWDYILQKNGSSMKKAESAIASLEKKVGKGSDETAEALDTLGIGLEEAQSMTGEELFETVVSSLQDVDSASERAALASALMGNSYTSLGTLLTSTAEETDALKGRAHELGLVMSEEGIASAVSYQDALEELEATTEGIRRTLGEELLPVIQPAKEALQSLLTSVDWAALGQALAGALGPAVQFLTEFILPLANVALSGVVATLSLLLEILGGLGEIGGNMFGGKTPVDTLLGEGLSVDELKERAEAAQIAYDAAVAAVEADTNGGTEVASIELINQLNARSQELQVATEAYERAKKALEGGGEGGQPAETPNAEETGAEIQATAAKAEAAQTSMLETFDTAAGEINAHYTQGLDEASQAAVDAIENTHSVMEENMAQLDANAYVWGMDMMRLLANGIVDGSNTFVLRVIDDLAEDIKKRLGFSEPEIGPLSDFHTYAPDMMQLFAKGIRDGRGLIEAAIGSSFDLGPMIAARNDGAPTMNYGGVSVVINAAPGQSADELYDVFSYRLAQDIADRRQVFST